MIELTEEQIAQALANPELRGALDRYTWLQVNTFRVDVSCDLEYQRRFIAFYRLRGPLASEENRRLYFTLLEENKTDLPNNEVERRQRATALFETVLDRLYEITTRWEKSFASKLVATLYPDSPVIDQYVLQNVGLAMDGREQILTGYNQLRNCVDAFLQAEMRQYLVTLQQRYPQYREISHVKMVDLVLWQTRE